MVGTTYPTRTEIERAGGLIRSGKLVAFPTETVYGLGANALDAEAVARIYAAKGRPSTSPLIVHVASVEMARGLATAWPREAEILARRFWPGPLTMVLPKVREIPDVVSAGLPTAGLRMPANGVALALIRAAGVPIAALSANRFTGLSPTTAAHVRESLGEAVDMILDGGPTDVGIESTVLSLSWAKPALLRPGMISKEEIEAAIGPVEIAGDPGVEAHPSPGMHHRHYAPRTRLVLVDNGAVPRSGRGVYLAPGAKMPADPGAYAAVLYNTLHRLDHEGLDWIAVERPPDAPAWAGVEVDPNAGEGYALPS
jgi:L-threonylcarbamoyladenylate synthase